MKLKSIVLLFVFFLAAFAPGLVAGTPPPPSSSCRVTPRPVGFPGGITEVRTLDPYVGTAPLTHVSIDACLASFARCAAENRTPFPFGEGLSVQWQHADMRFRVWLADGTLLFDTTLTHPTIGFGFPSYDGVTDFAGPSGTMHENFKQTLVTIEADISPKQAKFFAQPFTLTIEMTSPDGVTSFHQGLMTSQIDQLGSAGIVFKWNGVAP